MLGAGAFPLGRPFVRRVLAQDQAPNRPEFILVARNFRYSPDVPGIAIVLAVVATSLVGDGMRDVLDPTTR